MSDGTEAVQDEYREAVAETSEDPRAVDPKGRIHPHLMTQREIAEESLILLRAFGDALQALGDNPMLRAIPGMRGMFNK